MIRPKQSKLKLVKFSGFGIVDEEIKEEDFKRKLFRVPFSLTTRNLVFEENRNLTKEQLQEIVSNKNIDNNKLESYFNQENKSV